MKKYLLIPFIALCIKQGALAQSPGEWLWLKGSVSTNMMGVYGTLGIPSPTNNPPGLYEPCEWTDLNGNFWLYGGWGNSGHFADLWKYDASINMWAWIKGTASINISPIYGIQGVPAVTNTPGSRAHGMASWVDKQGNFWLFGGQTFSGNIYSDLWKYEIANNEWTWMKGPNVPNQMGIYGVQGIPAFTNNPGARYECAAAWIDTSGNFWQFGGITGGSTCFNDLWYYDISTNNWTWKKGSNLVNNPGSYGVKGIEDPANSPCARESHNHWIDQSGCLWVFGGEKVPSPYYIFNDLWRFNPATNNWTWMNGSNLPYQKGIYGTQCIPSPFNTPSARFETRTSWTDSSGNFFLFGGAMYNVGDSIWNDLWKYCVNINQWIWVAGDTLPNMQGYWGIQGIPSALNKPDGRVGGVGWRDNSSNLYLFGGGNPDWYSRYNDLWKFSIDTLCGSCSVFPSSAFVASNQICPGTCTDFINLSLNATTFQWSFSGATPLSSTSANPVNICYANPGAFDVQLIASNVNGSDTSLLSNYITVFPSPPPQSITQSGDTLFAIAGSASYQWYFNGNSINGATDYFYVAQASGDYNVVATDVNGCEVEAAVFNVVALVNAIEDQEILIFPNPVEDKVTIQKSHPDSYRDTRTATEISIYNVMGEKMEIEIPVSILRNQSPEINVQSLSPGLYYIEIISCGKTFRSKFVKQ